MSITTTETGYDSITHTFSTVSEITNNMNKIKPYELCIATDIDAVYYKDNLCNLHHIKDYTLPTATASVLGGVKIGENLNITNGVLSALKSVEGLVPISALIFLKNAGNPVILFPGTTWRRVAENRNIRGCIEGEVGGIVGGEDTIALSIANMPSHTHIQNEHTHIQNGHGHNHSTSRSAQAFSGGVDPSFHTIENNNGGGTYSGGIHASVASNQNTLATNQNTGSGSSFSIVNAFYKVHIWERVS